MTSPVTSLRRTFNFCWDRNQEASYYQRAGERESDLVGGKEGNKLGMTVMIFPAKEDSNLKTVRKRRLLEA
jgi:hypothetical protein